MPNKRFVAVAFAAAGVDMARSQFRLGCSCSPPTLSKNLNNAVDVIQNLADTIGHATGLNDSITGTLEGKVEKYFV